jgi:hypothetical protein
MFGQRGGAVQKNRNPLTVFLVSGLNSRILLGNVHLGGHINTDDRLTQSAQSRRPEPMALLIVFAMIPPIAGVRIVVTMSSTLLPADAAAHWLRARRSAGQRRSGWFGRMVAVGSGVGVAQA